MQDGPPYAPGVLHSFWFMVDAYLTSNTDGERGRERERERERGA